MRILALVLCVLAFGRICLAGYSPQYDSYVTQAEDSYGNISQTVLVDGTTTGDCWLNGGTYYIPNCPSNHDPGVTNTIGGVNGSGWGPSQDMFSYISYQTTVTIASTAGQSYQTSSEAEVYCSVGESDIFVSCRCQESQWALRSAKASRLGLSTILAVRAALICTSVALTRAQGR